MTDPNHCEHCHDDVEDAAAHEGVTVTLDYNMSFTFGVDQIWPDGDAPRKITAEEVRKVIDECGGAGDILESWDLLFSIGHGDVHVSVHVPANHKPTHSPNQTKMKF